MTRKRCHRRPVLPLPPRGLRPRLLPDQVRDLAMAHTVNLDEIAAGRACAEVMWQTMGGVLCWQRVAEQLGLGVDQMDEQHSLMSAVIARHASTGRVAFAEGEYDTARQGVMVMDMLAERVDRITANQAADWAERRCHALQALHEIEGVHA